MPNEPQIAAELRALVDVKPGTYRAPSVSSLAGRWTVESVVPAVLLRGDDGHTALVPVDEFRAWEPVPAVGPVPCDGRCAWGEHERRTA